MFVIFEDDSGEDFAIQARDVVKVELGDKMDNCEIFHKHGSMLSRIMVSRTMAEVVDMLNEALSSSDE